MADELSYKEKMELTEACGKVLEFSLLKNYAKEKLREAYDNEADDDTIRFWQTNINYFDKKIEEILKEVTGNDEKKDVKESSGVLCDIDGDFSRPWRY